MLHIKSLKEALPICEALGSEIRIDIFEYVLREQSLNLAKLALELHVTPAALTQHIKKLEDASLVSSRYVRGLRGMQRILEPNHQSVLIEFSADNAQSSDLGAGHYSAHSVCAPCGLDNVDISDEPAVFDAPPRFRANSLWFSEGFLQYNFAILRTLERVVLTFEAAIKGEAIFGLNDKVEISHLPKSAENTFYSLVISQNGITLNGERMSEAGIGDILEGETFKFKITAGSKSTVHLFSARQKTAIVMLAK